MKSKQQTSEQTVCFAVSGYSPLGSGPHDYVLPSWLGNNLGMLLTERSRKRLAKQSVRTTTGDLEVLVVSKRYLGNGRGHLYGYVRRSGKGVHGFVCPASKATALSAPGHLTATLVQPAWAPVDVVQSHMMRGRAGCSNLGMLLLLSVGFEKAKSSPTPGLPSNNQWLLPALCPHCSSKLQTAGAMALHRAPAAGTSPSPFSASRGYCRCRLRAWTGRTSFLDVLDSS